MRRRYKVHEIAEHNWTVRKLLKLFPDIVTAEDSKTSIGIVVTDAHIKAAVPGNPAQCAVAKAVSTLPGLRGGFIGRTTSWLVFRDGRAVRYRTPVSTYAKILAFDMAGKAEPGIYTLSHVPPAHLMAEMRRRNQISETQRARRARRKRPVGKKRQAVAFQPSHFRTWGTASLAGTE